MPTESQDAQNRPITVTLPEVASWTVVTGLAKAGPIFASIPALQRGLVWSPQQNELLWDSILRGFPIGAVVLSKWSEKLKKTAEVKDVRVTHHLLDGQQRCNAIAMGFSDPFVQLDPTKKKDVASILWLDLCPNPDKNSTRTYWVRATTTAHPWGYRRDDDANRLSASDVRDALKLINRCPRNPDYVRPSPVELWPCEKAAAVPVPIAWLLTLPFEDMSDLWHSLSERAAAIAAASPNLRWASKVYEFCNNPGMEIERLHIFKGISRARAARLVAIEAPEELLEESQLEKTINDKEGISNIEQLFQRLNAQGTKLDGEELAYSMIKAYWPDLEEPINKLSENRMPQARMVSLGVRAARATDSKTNLPESPTVSALRAIARSEGEKKTQIQNFIQQDLERACHLVDQWLNYDRADNPSGLLPVHVTSIAISSREVYLLLLHFAKLLNGTDAPLNWSKTMQGLATLLHWFAVDKGKVANIVFQHCRGKPSLDEIRSGISAAISAGSMRMIHTPEAVGDFIRLPVNNYDGWNWWSLIQGDGSKEGVLLRRSTWEGFLDFRNNRELLLYAQRDFVSRKFPDYNPARKDLWEAHNRPWDFDHILASYYFYNRKEGRFREICKEWGWTIGNLRAWPFEENRSDQGETAAQKIEGNPTLLNDSFLVADDELAFSGGDYTRSDEAQARLFSEKCRERLLRIYRTWYESMAISELLNPAT